MEPIDLILYPFMCLIIAIFFTNQFRYWFAFFILLCTGVFIGVIILLIMPPQKRRTWWKCETCTHWDYSDDTSCPHCHQPNQRKELSAKTTSIR